MPLQGSTAIRGIAELDKALNYFYSNTNSVSIYLCLYTDGGGDSKNSNFKVQKSLHTLFLKYDFDEIIAARPAANHSYRNPVERCHSIANLGLQSVGMMGYPQNDDFERTMRKCNGNADIQKECEKGDEFMASYINSIKRPRELVEEVLSYLSLKDEPFQILQPATEYEIEDLVESLSNIDENLQDMISLSEIDNHLKFKTFYEKHCDSRTYYFHVFKCDYLTCEFHKPIRGPVKVENFPDPVHYEEYGITRYQPGLAPAEKFLPSKLEDPEKRSQHSIPSNNPGSKERWYYYPV